jgi:hypothetical protein
MFAGVFEDSRRLPSSFTVVQKQISRARLRARLKLKRRNTLLSRPTIKKYWKKPGASQHHPAARNSASLRYPTAAAESPRPDRTWSGRLIY